MLCKFLRLLAVSFVVSSSLPAATVQFLAPQSISTPAQHLVGLTVADFDGDGHPDIAVSDLYSPNIYLYLNDGNGHFAAPLTLTFPQQVSSLGIQALASGDFNEDGKQDLIVSLGSGNQGTYILLGNGNGTFSSGQKIPSSYGFLHARVVDINGDKHLDLITGGNPTLSVFLGNGTGAFQAVSLPASSTPPSFVTALTIGDFNGDHQPDVVLGPYDTTNLLYYANAGNGSLLSPSRVSTSFFGDTGYSLDSADFNGDGKLDLLVAESQDVAVILPGHGDGSFTTADSEIYGPLLPSNPAAAASYDPPLIAAVDLNADGIPDILAADDHASILSAFLNDGTGHFSQSSPDYRATLDAGTGGLQVADLNGDGLPDIVLTNYKTQKISVFLSSIVKSTPSVSVQSSNPQALVGSSVSITVQVKGSAAHVPTGMVTLTNDSVSLGQQALDSMGQATFALPDLKSGRYALTATYAGDKYNNGATNTSAFSQTVTDFGVSLASSVQTVNVGASATYSLTIAPVANFNGSVAFSCSGLPAGYVCAPLTVPVTGSSTTASIVVSPPATIAWQPRPERLAVAFASLGCILLFPGRKRRRLPFLLLMLCFAGSSGIILSGCSNSAQKASAYRGTSTFQITATVTQGTVTVTHQTAATLTVQ